MTGDLARIEEWSKIFADPWKLFSTVTANFMSHFPQITGDITKTATDIGAANYYDAGTDIADIMVQTLGPVPAKKVVQSAQPESLEMTQW